MRCLTLAQYLKESGISVTFLCRTLEGNIISLIEEKQFKVIKLPSTIDESKETIALIKIEAPDWVVVDHYDLDIKWENNLKVLGIKIFAIDDLYRHHDCHGFLDQNCTQYDSVKYQGLTPSHATNFIGPHYCLLSPNFTRKHAPHRDFETVKKVLVFFGGSDPTGETFRFLKIVSGKFHNIKFDIVIGTSNLQKKEIQQICEANSSFCLHIQTNRMPELMEKADLFVGAGGTVTWERCYLGLPAICVTVAENQVQIARELSSMDIHDYLGNWDNIEDQAYIDAIQNMLGDNKRRMRLSKNSLNLKVSSKTKELIAYFKQ